MAIENMEILKYLDSQKNDKFEKLKKIIEELNKLNKAKLGYSIQELQSMNILDGNSNRNKKILNDANEFLNSANVKEFEPSEKVRKRLYGKNEEFINEKNVSDNIEINLDDAKSIRYTLLNIAFKANKYTKWLCERSKEFIAENNYELSKIVNELQYIHKNSNSETDRRCDENQKLKELAERIRNGEYDNWDKTFNRKIKDEEVEGFIEKLYADLSQIFYVEDVCYEIKSQINKQVLIALIQDNCGEFRWWISFDEDMKNMPILNVDSKKIVERFSFHIPDLSKVMSEQLKGILEEVESTRNKLADEIRKNNFDTINHDGIDKETKEEIIKYIVDKLKNNVIDNDVLLSAKFLEEESVEKIVKEYPELERACAFIKELIWVEPKLIEKDDEIFSEENKLAEKQKERRKKIEDVLIETKTIYIQKGEKLDKFASLYALQKYMKEKKRH